MNWQTSQWFVPPSVGVRHELYDEEVASPSNAFDGKKLFCVVVIYAEAVAVIAFADRASAVKSTNRSSAKVPRLASAVAARIDMRLIFPSFVVFLKKTMPALYQKPRADVNGSTRRKPRRRTVGLPAAGGKQHTDVGGGRVGA